jgi:hypothetical protein
VKSLARKIWGVDTVNSVDEELFDCVRNRFGLPKFWGRYLTAIPNVSSGLTKQELSYIRDKGIKVLPIYNVMNEAVGYDQALISARNAVYHARRLGLPRGTVLFAKVENLSNVDAAWIRGWVETLLSTGYRSGFYDSVEGGFAQAYCQAVKQNNEVAVQTILWSAGPKKGATSERKAPKKFNPAKPNSKANVWLWQYGRDTKRCFIDTNLADERVLTYLY